MGAMWFASGCAMVELNKDLHRAADQLVALSGTVELPDNNRNPKIIFVYQRNASSERVVSYQIRYRSGPFTFTLPVGSYYLAVFEDSNGDMAYQKTELASVYGAPSALALEPERPVEGIELRLNPADGAQLDVAVNLSSPEQAAELNWSRVTVGAIGQLDEERFNEKSGNMGLWQPLSFLEEIGSGVFMLEKYEPNKVPVLFVHGAAGFPQNFVFLIEHLDRERFQPWFFQYPSGARLENVSTFLARAMAEMYTKHKFEKLCVVAHSMGGLVSRAFVNEVAESDDELELIKAFVTISTPWQGHAASSMGVKHAPAVVPSWLDMVPGSPFQQKLFKQTLPDYLKYYLLFSYKGGNSRMAGGASDGAVAVESQLDRQQQKQAVKVYGFNESHVGILSSKEVSETLNAILAETFKTHHRP